MVFGRCDDAFNRNGAPPEFGGRLPSPLVRVMGQRGFSCSTAKIGRPLCAGAPLVLAVERAGPLSPVVGGESGWGGPILPQISPLTPDPSPPEYGGRGETSRPNSGGAPPLRFLSG